MFNRSKVVDVENATGTYLHKRTVHGENVLRLGGTAQPVLLHIGERDDPAAAVVIIEIEYFLTAQQHKTVHGLHREPVVGAGSGCRRSGCLPAVAAVFTHAVDDSLQLFGGVWLEQIVERRGAQGVDEILVVCRVEHDVRIVAHERPHLLYQVYAAYARHLHIHEEDVGLIAQYAAPRLLLVGLSIDHQYVVVSLQTGLQCLYRARFVVHDHG